jgi:hypothetical protein
MRTFPMAARRTRALAALLLAAELLACAEWRPEPGAPAVVLAAKRPDKVRANVGLDSAIVVVRPVVDGDTLRGQDERARHAIAIPLADVRLLETRYTKPGPTIAALVGGVALIAFIVAVATFNPLGNK